MCGGTGQSSSRERILSGRLLRRPVAIGAADEETIRRKHVDEEGSLEAIQQSRMRGTEWNIRVTVQVSGVEFVILLSEAVVI
ncbi:MAG: hypothetical protein ACOC2T_00905 [Planctomycetota bacterium]